MPSLDALREYDNHQQGRQDGGEAQRMREASVTEEVAVLDPEPEADDVDVGQCRTHHASEPDSSCGQGAPERGRERDSGDGVRQDGRHPRQPADREVDGCTRIASPDAMP